MLECSLNFSFSVKNTPLFQFLLVMANGKTNHFQETNAFKFSEETLVIL